MILFGILIFVGVLIVFLYNSLIRKKNEVERSFSTIDVTYKKRYDLIPHLVEVVKQYVKHEKETLSEITELRSNAVGKQNSIDEKVHTNNKISSLLKGIMVSVEAYPDLKANEHFIQLQKTWNEIEAQISAARRAYNTCVTEYNNAVEMFPTSIVATIMKYKERPLIEIPETE